MKSIAMSILMRVAKFPCQSVAGSLKFRCRPAPTNHSQGIDPAKILPMERTVFESEIEFFPAVREERHSPATATECHYRAAARCGR
jgi:hypothetical protein